MKLYPETLTKKDGKDVKVPARVVMSQDQAIRLVEELKPMAKQFHGGELPEFEELCLILNISTEMPY